MRSILCCSTVITKWNKIESRFTYYQLTSCELECLHSQMSYSRPVNISDL